MERCSQIGIVGKVATCILVVFAGATAVWNMANGEVHRPAAFVLVLLGFSLFAVAKLSVILKKKRISLGPGLMTTPMANFYRFGYWLMAVGVLTTFL